MPTTTAHGFVKPLSDTEPADLFGVAGRLADSVESVMCPAYTDVTFENSWTNYGSGFEEASFAKEGQRVYIRGAVKNATAGSTTVIFTLPAGYRPAKTRGFTRRANTGQAGITIDSAGAVFLAAYYASGTA